ncbi:glycosyltransferase [Lutimonas halocynthiae]|uniref:glycosyltransferase n=1 Tax=Lutimonas halocynthiae TaxID=1446477 RepID=UPI0025B4E5AD|nr:glycosyltransferase [Lutimonas halocynthiae]MDN3642104.1 glycosyltransferase [Lutimonas halocynthiae]
MSEQNKPLQKIKILYLISALKKCGPISVLYNIIKGLDSKTYDIYVLSLSEGEIGSVLNQFEALQIEFISLNQSRLKGLLFNKSIVQKILYDKQIDIVHSNDFRSDMINAKLNNVITINTIHNFPPEDYKNRYGKIMGSWMSIKHKNTIKKIQLPIACSKTVMNKFAETYKIKTNFIQNGIAIENFAPLTKDKNELRKSLNLPVDGQIFIVSGALTVLKNPKIIIEAFELQKNKDSVLLFLGNGELYDSLSSSYKSKNILFAGRVDNVKNYLRASDYYISASLTEGLPNSVLEAISIGLPVILSKIAPHVEIIGDNYPYLFDPNNSKDLNKKLKLIVQKENQKFSQQHALKMKINFSAHLMSNKYQLVYQSSMNSFKK